MDSPLKDFFRHERDKVIAPGPFFAKRVVARWKELAPGQEIDYGFWDLSARVSRPIFALAIIVFLGFFAVETLAPVMPDRGMVEAYLEPDQTPSESLLYSGMEPPNREELFVEMMGLEEQ
jgi:hypothetical protein